MVALFLAGALASHPVVAQRVTPLIVSTPQEVAAEQVLISFGHLVDAGKIDEAFRLYVSPHFVDHSDKARAMMHKQAIGYAETLPFFKAMVRPGSPALVQQITADDDIVTVRGLLGQDIFRVDHGQMLEHWDTLGSTPGALAGPQS